jgi:hypothetical protein
MTDLVHGPNVNEASGSYDDLCQELGRTRYRTVSPLRVALPSFQGRFRQPLLPGTPKVVVRPENRQLGRVERRAAALA